MYLCIVLDGLIGWVEGSSHTQRWLFDLVKFIVPRICTVNPVLRNVDLYLCNST